MNRIATSPLGVCACLSLCFGQVESPLARVRALNLPSGEGNVPVIYSPARKARAERYRATLAAAHEWYQAQLGVSVPVTLAVLDKQDWQRATSIPYPMPNSKTGLVTLPSQMEDFPGFSEMKADANILAESISFHELGHLFADKAGIGSRTPWLNELVANIFAQGYIAAHQPALIAYISPPPPDSLSPRYTSLADLDYLYEGVSFSNYAWFQFHLNRLGAFVARTRGLRQVVEELKIEFPAATTGLLALPEALRRLELVAPGFTDALGPLSKPTTIARVKVSSCVDAVKGRGGLTFLVIDNRTSRDIAVTQGGKVPIRVIAGKWRRLSVEVGEMVALSNQSCLAVRNEPSLAVIEEP